MNHLLQLVDAPLAGSHSHRMLTGFKFATRRIQLGMDGIPSKNS